MRFDWGHLQNWLPGALGASAAILLVVVAANSPTQTNSRPVEASPPQSAASSTQAGATPAPSAPASLQTTSVAGNAAKVPALPKPAATVTAGEATAPSPMRDHTMVMAQAEPAKPAQVQSSSKPDPQKAVADAASPQGDAVAGRQVFKKCQACHSLEPGKTILGPSLTGIVGRKSAADAGFQLFAGNEAGGFDVGCAHP